MSRVRLLTQEEIEVLRKDMAEASAWMKGELAKRRGNDDKPARKQSCTAPARIDKGT